MIQPQTLRYKDLMELVDNNINNPGLPVVTHSALANGQVLMDFLESFKGKGVDGYRIYLIRFPENYQDQSGAFVEVPRNHLLAGSGFTQIALAIVPTYQFDTIQVIAKDYVNKNKTINALILGLVTGEGSGLCPPRCGH